MNLSLSAIMPTLNSSNIDVLLGLIEEKSIKFREINLSIGADIRLFFKTFGVILAKRMGK